MDSEISSRTPRRLLFIFEILSLILLFSYDIKNIDKNTIIVGLGLIFIIYLSNLLLLKISKGDHYILLIANMLVSIGIVMIYRLEPEYGAKQLIWIALGIFCFYITYFVLKFFKFWDKLEFLYILGSITLFILTLVLGKRVYGAKNWISIFGIGFQPAELIKILLIFILSSHYSNDYKNYNLKESKKYSYGLMALIYLFVGFLFIQKDLGMALIFYGVFIVIQFIYEENRQIVYINILLFTISAILGYFLFGHVRVRFKIWVDPWKYINDIGYQITQSLFAIAEGGFFGKGLGLGHPEFIPLAYNDFIFPAIVEEMGIFTGIAIIMLYLLLVYRGFKIAMNQKNRFFKIMAVGVSALFATQSFIILGGVLKVIPLTGITLPFMAYGGTSILSSFIALGMLQVASEEVDWQVEDYE